MTAIAVFIATLIFTFLLALLGRNHPDNVAVFSEQKLNKWLLGLSAGATANSGFVVTGAVGLSYLFGYKWLLLPLGWFLGDLVFWRFFPEKLNRMGRSVQAASITDILLHNIHGRFRSGLKRLSAGLILICLAGYTMAQWLAGQKILAGAFGLSGYTTVILFAILVIAYSSIGGFRGSVYADTFQAAFRIVGSLFAIGSLIYFALDNPKTFSDNFSGVDDYFFSPLGDLSLFSAIAFVLGYAFASLGFGLGQPQVTTRYLAGRNAHETQAAKWIYIIYIQFTWVAMSIFGILLRGVMPELEDPEQGFAIYFQTYFPGVIAGIIIADIFAAMASTSNSLLVVMAQTVINDFDRCVNWMGNNKYVIVVVILGTGTSILSLYAGDSVVSLALTSIALLAAGLAPAMIVKLFEWQHSGLSLFVSMIVGFTTALAWVGFGYGSILSEAAPGILIGLLTNYVIARSSKIVPQL